MARSRLLPALVRLPPPHPHAADALSWPVVGRAERAVVARPGVRVRQRLVGAADFQERRRRPGRAGGVRVEALGHGAVRGLDLHLRGGAPHP